jgi:hypothetical protein
MSTVKGTTSITFVKQGDTINTSLRSTLPLEQYIKKGTSTIMPDWTQSANQPCIYPVVKSSLTDARVAPDAGSEAWTYNGTAISFDSNGLSLVLGSLEAGTFKKESKTVDGDTIVPTLTIKKNLASTNNINADVIGFSAIVNTGFSSSVAATIDIRIEEVEGDPYRGYIAVNDGGVIDDDTPSLTLVGNLLKGGVASVEAISYKWYKASANTWTLLASTSQSITISGSDIDNQELYKVEFVVSSTVVAQAVIQVSDESDLLIIVPNPDGAEELSTARKTINYYPYVCKRGDDSYTAIIGYAFTYTLTNSSYSVIATGSGTTFAVTYAHGIAAGGNLTLAINATA